MTISDETKIELANNDFTAMAAIILEGLGGKENVTSVDNCITRLRLEIKDYTAVDEKKIKSAGISWCDPSEQDFHPGNHRTEGTVRS